MTWNNLELAVPLAECKNSLLFNHGDIIASLSSSNGILVQIGVVGDVRILYEDNVYRYPDNYPDEITKALKDGTFGQMEYDGIVETINNNWFEVFVSKNNEPVNSDVWEMVLDTISEDKLRESLIDYINESYPDLLD